MTIKVAVEPGGQVIQVSLCDAAGAEKATLEPRGAERDFRIDLTSAAKLTIFPDGQRLQVDLVTRELAERYVFEPSDAPQVCWLWPGWSIVINELAQTAQTERAAA